MLFKPVRGSIGQCTLALRLSQLTCTSAAGVQHAGYIYEGAVIELQTKLTTSAPNTDDTLKQLRCLDDCVRQRQAIISEECQALYICTTTQPLVLGNDLKCQHGKRQRQQQIKGLDH